MVLENIARHIDDGMPPLKAAYVGTREVGFTLLSMNLSLVVVFVSILYMGGIVERLFREFSITLAAAIPVSLLVSLTLTPMLCARWLKPHEPEKEGRLQRWSHDAHQWLLRYYDRSLSWALRHRRITLLSLLATIALNVVLYVQVPKTFCRSRTPDRSPVSSAVTTACRSSHAAEDGNLPQGSPRRPGGGKRGRLHRRAGRHQQCLHDRAAETAWRAQDFGAEGHRAHPQEPAESARWAHVPHGRPDLQFGGGRQSSSAYAYTLLASDLNDLRTGYRG